MDPKQQMNEEKRRREVQTRLQFVKTRMPETVAELSVAKGRMLSLPKGQIMPPPWALAAARMAWETGFARLAKEIPDDSKAQTQGDVWELFAIYLRLVSFVQNPPMRTRIEEKQNKGLIVLRKSATKHVAKRFLKYIQKLERKFECKIPVPTLDELVEYESRSHLGSTKFVSPEDELVGLRTTTARIYYLLWFFWPMLVQRFNAPSIWEWLRTEYGETPSEKLVEAIVTTLRKGGVGAVSTKPQP